MSGGILVSVAVLMLHANPVSTQQPQQAQTCVAESAPTPEQTARRRQGVQLARIVHSAQVNQPGASAGKYLTQSELITSLAARQAGTAGEFFKSLNFEPGAELLPGWEFKLDVTAAGYWFSLKDKTDPCGFALMSNHDGIIFQATPLR